MSRLWIRVPGLGFGLGALAGAFEMVQICSRLALDLSAGEGLTLAALCVGLNGLLGVGIGVPVGILAELLGRDRRQAHVLAAAMSAVGFGLAAFFLGRAAANLWEQGRSTAAGAFALSPLGVAGVVWFNASYWFRREELGEERRLGFRALAVATAGLIAGTAGLLVSARSFGGEQALPSDPDVILVTVDTLRNDHISYSNPSSPSRTPTLDGLAGRGVGFLNAVTPLPETLPAHSALFTSRHPIRTHVLSNADTLRRGYLTLAERLEEEGYANAAFVSSYAVDARTGLDQGFAIYDDDFLPHLRGLSKILVAEYALRAWLKFGDPTRLPFLYERPAPQTCARALRWIGAHPDAPIFVWVHLFEPHSPYQPHGMPGFEDNGTPDAPALDHRAILAQEPGYAYSDAERARLQRLYAEEVAYTDQELGRFLAGLDALGRTRPRALVVTADHGEGLGEHGVNFTHHGIWEEMVHVPLVIVPPEGVRMVNRRITSQVRLMDVGTAIADMVHLTPGTGTEGFPLMAMAEGVYDKGISTLIVGRRTASLREGLLYGYRSGGVKYHMDPSTGAEQLYDLDADPGELIDRSKDLPELLVTARERVRDETGGKLVQGAAAEDLKPEDRERLKALGYQE